MLSFEDLRTAVVKASTRRAAVICPYDDETLSAVVNASAAGLIEPVLVGEPSVIAGVLQQLEIDPNDFEIMAAGDPEQAARIGVQAVREGEAELLMKGLLDTKLLLRAVLDAEQGLRTGRVLSHVAVFELESYSKLLFLSDAAINILPSLEQKAEIIMNAVEVAKAARVGVPKVAMICAKEKPDPKMPATMDADTLRHRAESGELGACMVSGPLALDNAVNVAAARQKGISDPVAGRADVLIVPNIEAGNALYKALVFLAGAENAGIVVGASAPIVLTSRADTEASKLNSIALAALHAGIGAPS